MPGFDRTGPAGMGPMTGGGRGRCGGGRRFYGGGQGFGYGRGFGPRGGGRRFAAAGPYYAEAPYIPWSGPASGVQEADMLKRQASALEEELAAVKSRLNALESES